MKAIRVFFVLSIVVLESFGADQQSLLVTKVVEDDASVPGGQVFRMMAEDETSVYELACSIKKGTSSPTVDKRLFKGLPKNLLPDDTQCGPFLAGRRYSVMFHQADPRHSRVDGRLVTFMVEDANSRRVTRTVVFKVERAESK